jgi:hypothetical protein
MLRFKLIEEASLKYFVGQETVDGLIIELNNYSRARLKKYADICFPNDKALPVISNVKMNEHLKTMGKLAGIDEPQRVRRKGKRQENRNPKKRPNFGYLFGFNW